MNTLLPLKRNDFVNIALTCLLLASAFLAFFLVDTSVAKNFDRDYGFWVQVTVVVITLIGLGVNLPSLTKLFIQNQPRPIFWLGCLMIVTLVGVFGSQEIELQHRVLSDESSWESMGIQMFYNQRAGVCNQGIFTNDGLNCIEEVNNFKGKTTGILYWLLFQFLEPNRDSALLLNFPLFLLSLVFLFYGSWLIFKRPWVALSAALFLGTMPKMLFQSRTATTEVAYVFFFSLLLVIIPLLQKENLKWKHTLLVLPLLGLLAGTRQETLFSFIPFVLIYAPLWRQSPLGLPSFIMGMMVVCFPIVVTIAAYKGFKFQGGEYEPHSFYNLFRNFWDNINVMLNLEPGYQGLLNYPFSTTQTLIILLGAIYLTVQAIWTGKYRNHLVLFLLFFIQPLVVMINVSGNFTIDINQRYVLVILPIFALVGALAIEELGLKISAILKNKLIQALAPSLSFILLAGLFCSLLVIHKESYNANIHYKKNKLLEEEKFLNTYLKTLPPQSIFIYSRPWQMISQHLNAFSESRFLGWNQDELNQWQLKSSNNIYLVRGQDGYGKVNNKSRVVGFKTTDKVEKILKNFKTEELVRQTRPFGYALTVHKIVEKSTGNPFANKTSIKVLQSEINQKSLSLEIKKKYPEPLKYKTIQMNSQVLIDTLITQAQANIRIPLINHQGIVRLKHHFEYSDETLEDRPFSIYIPTPNTSLLTKLPINHKSSGWASTRINKSVESNSLKIKGELFPWGIGTHSDSKTNFILNNSFKVLHIGMGMDDESMCGDGSVFEIWGDDQLLYKSPVIFAEELNMIEVPVKGVNELSLKTHMTETDLCDHTNWVNPWLSQ